MSWPLSKSLLPSLINDPLTSYWAGPYDVAKFYSSSDNGEQKGGDPPCGSLNNTGILPTDDGSFHARTVQANTTQTHRGHADVPVSGANRSHIANHRSLPQSAASSKRRRENAFHNKELAGISLSQTDSRIQHVRHLRPRDSSAPANSVRDVGPSTMQFNPHNPGDTAPKGSKPRGPRPRHRYHPKYSSMNWKAMHKQYCMSDTGLDMLASRRSLPAAQPRRPSDKGVHSTALARERGDSIECTPDANVLRAGSMPATLHPSTRQLRLESSKMQKQRPPRSAMNRALSKGKKAKPMAPPSALANHAGGPHARGTLKIPRSNGIQLSQRDVEAPAVSLASSRAPSRNFVMRGPRPPPALHPSARVRQVPPHQSAQAASSSNLNAPDPLSNISAQGGGIPQERKLLSSRSTALHRSASMHRHSSRLLAQAGNKSGRALHTRAALVPSESKVKAKPAASTCSFQHPGRDLSVTKNATHKAFDIVPPPPPPKSAGLVGSYEQPSGPASKLSVAPSPRKLQCSMTHNIKAPAERHAFKNVRKAEHAWGNPPSEVVDAPARHERTSISTAASSTPPITPQDSKADLPAIVDERGDEDWGVNSNRQISFSDVGRPAGHKNTNKGTEGISERESFLLATEDKAQMTWNHLAALGLRFSPIEDSECWHSPLGTPQTSSSSSDSSFTHATLISEPMDVPIIIQQIRTLAEDVQFGPKQELLARFAQRKATRASNHKGTSTGQHNDIDHHLDLHPDVVCTLAALRSPI